MTTTTPPGQPATPAEALRHIVELIDPGPLPPGANDAQVEVRNIALMMSRWADELDAAPATPERANVHQLADELIGGLPNFRKDFWKMLNGVIKASGDQDPTAVLKRMFYAFATEQDHETVAATAAIAVHTLAEEAKAARATDPGPDAPTTYELPAEPPVGTQLWNQVGRWTSRQAPWKDPGDWPAEWCLDGQSYGSGVPWHALLAAGPLSVVPPAGTRCTRCGQNIDPNLTAVYGGPDAPRHGTCPTTRTEADRGA